MQQNLAREMRPYLYSFDTYIAPGRPPAFDDVYGGLQSAGNLTEMSKQQMAVAQKAHQTAMQQVREVAKTVNTNIYYLGTSETEHLSPEHIRQMVGDIEVAQDAVAGAQVIWGQEPSLEKASLYLQQVRQFYSMLGTGIYEHINPIANPVIKRADGHVYNAEEFGLRSHQVTHKIPYVTTPEEAAWVRQTYGELPQRMRVAVLQDDKDMINALRLMRQKVGLEEWKLDFYDDPEAFLNSPKALQYDMVLTDVLIKNGGGRYLARQLRSRGYEGSIITISGFEASTHSGESFFADGVDGMIALGWATDFADKIWYGLTTYFQLKAQHGWIH
jgi:CheY-like chemotaxis protein